MEQAIKVTARRAALFSFVLVFGFWLTLYFGWHLQSLWTDNILHFSGGVWLASLFDFFIYRTGIAETLGKPWLRLFFGLSFVALFSVLWEGYEFLGDLYLQKHFLQPGLPDTMTDFMNDLSGALVFFSFFWPRKKAFVENK